ncbi:Gldg family protein [Candidatus Dependentiae bacterium]|nr:Gldg family protein [Candidatus Dependentiae bacterium]
MINYLSYRHYYRFDCTKSNIYSLSDYTEKVLDKIKNPMHIWVFIPSNIELYENIQELLNTYKSYNKNIAIEYIDPIKNQLKANEIAKKYNLTSPDLVIFEYDEQVKYVTYNDIVEYDYIYGRTPKISSFKGEQKFTSIILSIIEKEKKTVYFTEGHNERKIESSESYDGFDILKQEILEKGNFNVKPLLTVTLEKIPDDCSLLVILAPEFDFLQEEIKLISEYLESGGKLMVCLEPSIGKKDHKLLLFSNFLKKYGIHFDNTLLLDPSNNFPLFGKGSIVASEYDHTGITKFLSERKLPSIFNISTSLSEIPTDKNVKIKTLIKTSESAFQEKNLTDLKNIKYNKTDNSQKQYGIALLSEPDKLENIDSQDMKLNNSVKYETSQISSNKLYCKNEGFALLAVGDADFMSNNLINNAGNLTFVRNAINYLTEKKELISFPAKSPEKVQLTLASNDMFFIFFVSLIALPVISILSGILIWWRRKK